MHTWRLALQVQLLLLQKGRQTRAVCLLRMACLEDVHVLTLRVSTGSTSGLIGRIPAAACATSARAACCGIATAAAAPETPGGPFHDVYLLSHNLIAAFARMLTRFCRASTTFQVVFVGKVKRAALRSKSCDICVVCSSAWCLCCANSRTGRPGESQPYHRLLRHLLLSRSGQGFFCLLSTRILRPPLPRGACPSKRRGTQCASCERRLPCRAQRVQRHALQIGALAGAQRRGQLCIRVGHDQKPAH